MLGQSIQFMPVRGAFFNELQSENLQTTVSGVIYGNMDEVYEFICV